MENQERFMELMEELRQIATTQHNFITKEDIVSYLEDMDINSTQMDAVYNYLSALGVVVEGHHYVSDISTPHTGGSRTDIDDTQVKIGDEKNQKINRIKSKKKAASSKNKKTEIGRAERNRVLYKRDLDKVETAEGDELLGLVADFLEGDDKARERFIENRLKLVLKLAEKYRKMDIVSGGIVPIEEVIAEGNLGLLLGVNVIRSDSDKFIDNYGKPDLDGIDELLRIEIIRSIETFIDGHMSGRDMENAMLARINLLHEAAKYMTEEMGRLPLKEELSEYTKIPVEEIEQIMCLSEDAKRISDE